MGFGCVYLFGIDMLHFLAFKHSWFNLNPIYNPQGQCDVDIENNRRQTPLLLAIGQGHAGVVDLFVAKGANVNAVDEDGDSSLHLALMRQNVYTTTSPELMDAVSFLWRKNIKSFVHWLIFQNITRSSEIKFLHFRQEYDLQSYTVQSRVQIHLYCETKCYTFQTTCLLACVAVFTM